MNPNDKQSNPPRSTNPLTSKYFSPQRKTLEGSSSSSLASTPARSTTPLKQTTLNSHFKGGTSASSAYSTPLPVSQPTTPSKSVPTSSSSPLSKFSQVRGLTPPRSTASSQKAIPALSPPAVSVSPQNDDDQSPMIEKRKAPAQSGYLGASVKQKTEPSQIKQSPSPFSSHTTLGSVLGKPASQGKPSILAKPSIISTKPTISEKPAVVGKPIGTAKPTTLGKPVGTAKPTTLGKPVGTAKPNTSGKPIGTAKPSPSRKPTIGKTAVGDIGKSSKSATPEKTQQLLTKASVAATTPSKSKDLTASYSYNTVSDSNKPLKAVARLPWLEFPRDENKRTPDDPDYDPRTLYIPLPDLMKLSEFERQYWEIKKKYFDTLIFFKKGKFYELYEKDADVGHEKLELKMTERVNMRMVGVPESHFYPWAAKLINMGYKVGRVDQTETQFQKEKRTEGVTHTPDNKNKAEVLKRELTKLYTVGTLVDVGLINGDQPNFLMSLYETSLPAEQSRYGVCLLDSSTGTFHLSLIEDNKAMNGLETLILQTKPREVIHQKDQLSKKTLGLFRRRLGSALMTVRNPDEFWKLERTVHELNKGKYFESEDKKTNNNNKSHQQAQKNENNNNSNGSNLDKMDMELHTTGEWPKVLVQYSQCEEVMAAVGGLLSYLRELKLDKELIDMRDFRVFDPIHTQNSLVLDGQTLFNLEILENNIDGTEKGTLLALLNQAVTPFGKRLFKNWLCHPLVRKSDIDDRLDAVDDLNAHNDMQFQIGRALAKVPDLERVVARIYAGSSSLKDLLQVLDALRNCHDLVAEIKSHSEGFKSKLLLKVLFEGFPNLQEPLDEFKNRFKMKLAKEEGIIEPFPGVEQDYDEATDALKDIEGRLEVFKENLRARLKCKEKLNYKNMGKFPFQLEVPKSYADKVPSDFYVKSHTKAINRYYCPELEALIRSFKRKEEELQELRQNLLARQLVHFRENAHLWNRAISSTAFLDCLLSLAKVSRSSTGSPVCRPLIVEGESPFLAIDQMTHPCVANIIGSDFIPNNLSLGRGAAKTVLLTGPNMGGKSTTLRSTCIAIIMAQLGCYVHASECALTPVDRIFTRIGANDDIMSGQSTFMMELTETSSIMKHATKHSLVILDELGRGTSTFDGYSIAYSVLGYLACNLSCRTLFATHYHKLADEFADSPFVSLQHMQCLVDEENDDVTFLYQLSEGVCSKSFGMNVAKKAGLSERLVQRAKDVALQFEKDYGYSRENIQSIPTDFYQLVAILESNHDTPEEKVAKLMLLQQSMMESRERE